MPEGASRVSRIAERLTLERLTVRAVLRRCQQVEENKVLEVLRTSTYVRRVRPAATLESPCAQFLCSSVHPRLHLRLTSPSPRASSPKVQPSRAPRDDREPEHAALVMALAINRAALCPTLLWYARLCGPSRLCTSLVVFAPHASDQSTNKCYQADADCSCSCS